MKEERKDGLYLINNRRLLYWQDGKWWTPIKTHGCYSGNIMPLEKQPKVIKTCERYRTMFD